MKKLPSVCMKFLILLSLGACSNEDHSAAPSGEKPSNSPEQVTGMTKLPTSGSDAVPEQQERNEEIVLIAYFSMDDIVIEGMDAVSSATPYVGNTESVALEIQKHVGGDLFQIATERSYPVDHKKASAIAEDEMRTDARPVLTTHVENMEDYDIVYLGYPIWWYIEPMAIRTFLEEYDFSGKTIIPFCTSLGVDINESVENIKKLSPDATILDGLRLRTEQKNVSKNVTEWLNKIKNT